MTSTRNLTRAKAYRIDTSTPYDGFCVRFNGSTCRWQVEGISTGYVYGIFEDERAAIDEARYMDRCAGIL